MTSGHTARTPPAGRASFAEDTVTAPQTHVLGRVGFPEPLPQPARPATPILKAPKRE